LWLADSHIARFGFFEPAVAKATALQAFHHGLSRDKSFFQENQPTPHTASPAADV
jgi:hypothetical protein